MDDVTRVVDSEPRNIVLFVPSLTHGGAEQVAVSLANSFAKHGIETIVLTATDGDDLSEQLVSNVTFKSLGASRVLTSIPALSCFLRKQRPDTVISFLTHTNIATIMANWFLGSPIRIVVTEHETISRREKGYKEKIILKLASILYPWSDAIVAVSEGLKDEVQWELHVDQQLIHCIPNPIRLPEMVPTDKTESHSWFDEPIPVIVAAGRHEPVKDFSTLLRAIALLRDVHNINVRLILLGNGSLTTSLRQLTIDVNIQSQVDFPGFVDNPYPYYEQSDILVLSSKWEGFGNVLVEAMAVGTPVVATDCPVGPAEILSDGEYGELVPVGDPERMAEALLNTLCSPPDKGKLQERAGQFSPERISKQYLELMNTGQERNS